MPPSFDGRCRYRSSTGSCTRTSTRCKRAGRHRTVRMPDQYNGSERMVLYAPGSEHPAGSNAEPGGGGGRSPTLDLRRRQGMQALEIQRLFVDGCSPLGELESRDMAAKACPYSALGRRSRGSFESMLLRVARRRSQATTCSPNNRVCQPRRLRLVAGQPGENRQTCI